MLIAPCLKPGFTTGYQAAMRRVPRLPAVLILIFAAAFLVGCSSSSTPAGSAAGGGGLPVASPTLVVAPASGISGGVLTVAATADIPHRDVHQEVQETLTALGPGLAYSRLLRLRSDPDLAQPHLLVECDLCQSWSLTEDFAYEFKLREGVRWQNITPVNGRPLTADDLVLSYARLRTPGWPNAPLLSSIGQIEILDGLTLRVNLSVEDADALAALADGHSKIAAGEVWAEFGDLRDSPVIGTGPWIVEESGPGVGTRLAKHPDYFEPGLPFLDQLNVVVIKSDPARSAPGQAKLAAFEAGLVDVVPVLPGEWAAFQGSNTPFKTTTSYQSGAGAALMMNTGSEALSQQTVRQAVLRAIDPWDYLDTVWQGQGLASVGVPVQQPEWLLGREALRDRYFADPGKARKLLRESGMELPVDLEVTLRTELYGDAHVALEERIRADLASVGFNPTLRWMNPEQFNELVIGPEKEYQLAIGAVPPTSTTNSFLLALLHSQGRWNLAGHQDTVLDSLIEGQSAEFDPEKRREQLQAVQERVLDQGYLFTLASSAIRWVHRPELRGFAPNTALSEYNYWSRAWLAP